MKKSLQNLVGHKIDHFVFGECEVVEITDLSKGKFIGKVVKDDSVKKLIFSSNFFRNIEEYESIALPVFERKEKKVYQKPDLTKYRNHPFVKSIDWKITKERQKIVDNDIYSDDIEDDEEELD